MTSSATSSLRRLLTLAAALILLLSLNVMPDSAAQNSKSARAADKSPSASGDVARGKYIVESVSVCSQCHTPRDASGNLDRSRWLQGGQVPYQSSRPDMDWPILAPRIGGTLPANDADMVKLLTTGIWTNGTYLRLPMPQFRLDRSDAEAVVAYLKTVNPQP
jgi:mono/diheme cytochrome c family protein